MSSRELMRLSDKVNIGYAHARTVHMLKLLTMLEWRHEIVLENLRH
jgi:uncharacterized protein YxjI